MAEFSPTAPHLTSRFVEALRFSIGSHGQQVRKGTEIPYVAHLLGVASIALENGADEDQAIAALLHDAVEDASVTVEEVRSRFGDRVANMVSDCTDREEGENRSWDERKAAYIASLASKPVESLLVSVSDKTHNARAIVDDLAIVGPALWNRFTGGRDGSLRYYRALADAFRARLPDAPVRRFAEAVREMERLAGEAN